MAVLRIDNVGDEGCVASELFQTLPTLEAVHPQPKFHATLRFKVIVIFQAISILYARLKIRNGLAKNYSRLVMEHTIHGKERKQQKHSYETMIKSYEKRKN